MAFFIWRDDVRFELKQKKVASEQPFKIYEMFNYLSFISTKGRGASPV